MGIVGRRFRAVVVSGLIAAALMVQVEAADQAGPREAARNAHVRTEDPAVSILVEEGVRRSPTFRALIDELETSDVVVYVDRRCCLSHDEAGFVAFVASVGGCRYLAIHIDARQSHDQMLAMIGHELRHAVEIANSPEVVNEPALAALYERIGFPRDSGVRRFDSHAAIAAGWQILRELGPEAGRAGRE